MKFTNLQLDCAAHVAHEHGQRFELVILWRPQLSRRALDLATVAGIRARVTLPVPQLQQAQVLYVVAARVHVEAAVVATRPVAVHEPAEPVERNLELLQVEAPQHVQDFVVVTVEHQIANAPGHGQSLARPLHQLLAHDLHQLWLVTQRIADGLAKSG